MADEDTRERYMTTAEAAGYIRVSPHTLRRWRVEGTGPTFVRVSGNKVAYDVEDLRAFMDARKVGGPRARAAGSAAAKAGGAA